MILLVCGACETHRRFDPSRWGHLLTPRGSHDPGRLAASGQPWACDNDAFAGFDPAAFRRMLGRVAGVDRSGLLWVACPDVVGDTRATLGRFEEWEPELSALGLPTALVGQDGAEDLDLPWVRASALFLGGSTEWKLSTSAEDLVMEARRRGLWVHMGRASTRRRLRHAAEIGCDSADSTAFGRWPEKLFPRAMAWLREFERQGCFLGA